MTTAGNLDNSGTIDLAPGTLNVTGTYGQWSRPGALDVGIGGTTAGSQFGQLNVTGHATLNARPESQPLERLRHRRQPMKLPRS